MVEPLELGSSPSQGLYNQDKTQKSTQKCRKSFILQMRFEATARLKGQINERSELKYNESTSNEPLRGKIPGIL